MSSTSDSRLQASNIVDELVPALNHLMNSQQTPPPPPLPSLLSSINKPVESPPIIPQTTVNHQIETTISTTNVTLRSSNKSFSNRLGMMIPTNQTQNSIVQPSKSIPSAHQYLPQKTKSPVTIKQPTISPNHKNPNESRANEILPSAIPKCKFFFPTILYSILISFPKVKLN